MSLSEAPIASHLLYTQPGVLRDTDPVERGWGIEAGLVWYPAAEASVVYVDRGISAGMTSGIERARKAGIPVIYRSLYAKGPAKDGAFLAVDRAAISAAWPKR